MGAGWRLPLAVQMCKDLLCKRLSTTGSAKPVVGRMSQSAPRSSLCANRMNSTDAARFVMLQLKDLESVIASLGRRVLQPRDAGVLLALMAHTDTYTGRIYVTADQIAEDLQANPSEIRAALARLKKEHLLRLVLEKGTGRRFYLINPHVVQSGRPQAIGMAMQQFAEA